MSADNAWTITTHPDGGYALVMYFMSAEQKPVVGKVEQPSFPTIEAAVIEYAKHANDKYWSEYGLDVSPEAIVQRDQRTCL